MAVPRHRALLQRSRAHGLRNASNRGLFLLWFPIGERSVPGVKGFFLGAAVKPLTLVKGASGSPMKNSEGEKRRIEIEKTDVVHPDDRLCCSMG